MALIIVERIGGLAGLGGPGSRIASRGQIELESLSADDRERVEALFARPRKSLPPVKPDGFTYRISRAAGSRTRTIDVPEELVPAAVAACVVDRLA
jgi:hypothetical protein